MNIRGLCYYKDMSDYKIAICDDTEADRNYIKDLVTRWAHSSNQQSYKD